MFEFIKTFFIGIFVGIANVIPGISGGTLVVVFNIYDKFINAITLNVKKLIKNWKFVVPILLGMVSGILIFSKVITILYEKCPNQTNFFFTGLLIGSFPLLINYIKDKKEKKSPAWIVSILLCVFVGLALILAFYFIQLKFGNAEKQTLILPDTNTKLVITLFIAGILGAIAMIIPGISGSLIMLILGIYPIIISAIPAMLVKDTFVKAVCLLLPNGIGILIGLFSGAKLISFLLKKMPNQTYALIFGLIVASAGVMFPYSAPLGFANVVSYMLSLLLGVALAYFSSKLSNSEK